MAEETLNVVETEVTEQVDTQTEEETPQEKTYTETEMQKIIKDRVSREKKAAEKAIEEAKKLERMNADEKREYELEQAKMQLQEYKLKDEREKMVKQASGMFAEKEIEINILSLEEQEILFGMAVSETAEETKIQVDVLTSLVSKLVMRGINAKLRQDDPKDSAGNSLSGAVNAYAKARNEQAEKSSKANDPWALK